MCAQSNTKCFPCNDQNNLFHSIGMNENKENMRSFLIYALDLVGKQPGGIKELAKKVGVKPSYLQNIAAARERTGGVVYDLGEKTASRIAEYFGISLSELLDEGKKFRKKSLGMPGENSDNLIDLPLSLPDGTIASVKSLLKMARFILSSG